jgi:hypothetical protein
MKSYDSMLSTISAIDVNAGSIYYKAGFSALDAIGVDKATGYYKAGLSALDTIGVDKATGYYKAGLSALDTIGVNSLPSTCAGAAFTTIPSVNSTGPFGGGTISSSLRFASSANREAGRGIEAAPHLNQQPQGVNSEPPRTELSGELVVLVIPEVVCELCGSPIDGVCYRGKLLVPPTGCSGCMLKAIGQVDETWVVASAPPRMLRSVPGFGQTDGRPRGRLELVRDESA